MGVIYRFALALVNFFFPSTATPAAEPAKEEPVAPSPVIASCSTVEDKKYKKEPIPKELRNQVWRNYHGSATIGCCYVCSISVTVDKAGWHCSHVIAEVKGGPTALHNLRVCCPSCNRSMGDQNLYAYAVTKRSTKRGQAIINSESYFKTYPAQRNDKRTNNWS